MKLKTVSLAVRVAIERMINPTASVWDIYQKSEFAISMVGKY